MHNLLINIPKQRLTHYFNDKLVDEYLISSALKGVGEVKGSNKTPRGLHIIRAKIGAGFEENAVFVGRRPSGEIFSEKLKKQYPMRDWILTRIMWLSGLEKGKNRLGNVDTMQRFIYIHGVPDSYHIGVPGSKGCINMRNSEIIKLFDIIPVGTRVLIES